MLLATTPLTNNDNDKYQILGIVTGLSIRSMSAIMHLIGDVTSIFGMKQNTSGVQGELEKAREEAINEMIDKAKQMGADDIFGIDVQMSEISRDRSAFLVCSAVGTAMKRK